MKLANCATHRRPLAAGSRRPGCYARLHPSHAFRADDSNNPNLSSRETPSTVKSHSAGLNSDGTTPAWRQSVPGGHLAQSSSSKRPSPLDAGHTQPLWKKACFPGVAIITLATLPFDLAYNQHHAGHSSKAAHSAAGSMGYSRKATNPSSSNAGFSSSVAGLVGSPPRHAKATAKPGSSTPASAPTTDIGAVKSQTSAATAAAGGQNTFRRQQWLQTDQHDTPRGTAAGAGTNASRIVAEATQAAHAAESAAAAAQAAASRSSHAAQSASNKRSKTAPARADAAAAAADAAFKQQPTGTTANAPLSWGAAAGVAGSATAAAAGRPIDSWDAGDAGVLSDEEAEQKAKAMVIELLTHPKDTEEALLRAAESSPGGGDGSGDRPLSVSPDYIDALVQAVREPTVGMPHQQPSAGQDVERLGGSGSSGSSELGPTDTNAANSQAQRPAAGTQVDRPASPSAAAAAAAAPNARLPSKRAGSPSLWSWMEASPHSSQDEF